MDYVSLVADMFRKRIEDGKDVRSANIFYEKRL